MRPLLIAVDSNVLMDEEDGEGDVLDALATIRARVTGAEFVVTETVFQELAWLSENGHSHPVRELANGALKNMLARRYTPLVLSPLDRGIACEVALKLRMRGIVPDEEENDSLAVAEAAMKGCGILLSSDNHLVDINKNSDFWAVLEECDTEETKLLVARPREIVRKFMHKR